MSSSRLWDSCAGLGGLLRARWLVTGLGLGLAMLANPAMGQGGNEVAKAKEQPPLDVNAIQPGNQPPTQPGVDKPEAPPPEARPGDAQPGGTPPVVAVVDDGKAYTVSRFVFEYRSDHPDHLGLEVLEDAKVKLGVTPDGFVHWREGLPSVEMRIADVQEGTGGGGGGGGVFFRSAINDVARAAVEAMNKKGFYGIFVQLADIDDSTGADRRAGARSEMRLVVWTGKVGQVRSIASGERLAKGMDAGSAARINSDDPVHARVRSQSPLQEGDLLRKDRLDDYVARLNRHAGRRVDVAISPGNEDEQVVVDYLVAESKPWSVYGQLSNTGTTTTNEWRERLGFVHNQISGHDDVLRVDYTTAGFDASHALLLSYEFPILSDRLRAKVYGSYTEFTASDVGNSTDDFEGRTWTMGAELTGNVWQHREAFVDVYGGVRWKSEQITESGGNRGDENFYFPYVGAKFERFTESSSTYVDLGLEMQWDELSKNDDRDIQDLGRPEVDESWQIFKFAAEYAFFLEPLLNPRGYRGEDSTGPKTLAHEVSASVRGQYAFGYRLIASEEEIAGGLFSVRGYPESVIAADSLIIGSLEYRFHVPRALGIADAPGTLLGRKMGLFGQDFRWQPQQPFGRADWDLILRGFVDAARSKNGEGLAITEENFTLIGTGIGAELQVKRNLTMRVDWGIALQDMDDPGNEVSAGDNRVHFSVTVLY
ncbi:hypothetical protein PHYC_02623 [Phycisphaerales bacterium]|nr:hypothetical protein PHYC_02623 [Phycisphaerales bacterium]